MFTGVRKRDGREVVFEEGKITEAIFKAAQSVGGEDKQTAMELTIDVLRYLKNRFNGHVFTVEDVQDIVEKILIEKGHAKTAKAYILYRDKRTRIRETRSEMMDAVAVILRETSRENANVGNSPSAKILQISEVASKEYYLKRVIPQEQTEAHISGDFYIHDLAWYGKTTTCLQIPLHKLLGEGFNNGHGYIRSPKSIKTAAALSAIILQSNQNDHHGGQSFGFFDRDMGVYVEKEFERQEKILRESLEKLGVQVEEEKFSQLVQERVEDEVFQAMEGFVYNLNTMHSRAGAQVPFSSINLGTDTTRGGRMITEKLLKAYEKGLGKGEAPIFPNICFKIKEGINYYQEDPNYDLFKLSMQVACKRLFPNFSFQDASFNSIFEDEVAYMGCRTRVMANINGPEVTDGRGNLSFTTINLPRLGIKAKGDLSVFWSSLDKIVELTIKQLLTRYDFQKRLKVKDFPFLMGQKLHLDSEDLDPEDPIEKAIKHDTLSIGFIGLAEALIALTGKHHGESQESQGLGLSIINHLRRKCDEASKKYSLNFSLLATPAEGLSGKFVSKDREVFGEIPGITDKEWYTNSFHIPVDFKIGAIQKINIEGAYHKLCNAGHISYVELPSAPTNNIEAFESIVQAMYEADMGYAAVNFPVDICKECGFNGVIDTEVCPACGTSGKISRVRRITGYLSTLEMFNDAKKAEEKNRVKHMEI
ncbi:MAG: ribonucleoside-triphosphate reductase [Clostridiaceae bacterium BRH_c20a]|nr:MAG: ribonucleoside-triphosphate reductase [Clostridiaceae bacterium BRH_c20a]